MFSDLASNSYSSSSNFLGNMQMLGVFAAVALVLAIVATVLACIFILPEKKVASMNKFLFTLHNIANFKSLLIEKIIKVLYVFSTCYVILAGFFSIFAGNAAILAGLMLMVLGPIAIRLVYEMFMMFILLVQNTIAIRNKISGVNPVEKTAEEPASVAPSYEFCTKCGTRFDATKGGCPNCSGK